MLMNTVFFVEVTEKVKYSHIPYILYVIQLKEKYTFKHFPLFVHKQ